MARRRASLVHHVAAGLAAAIAGFGYVVAPKIGLAAGGAGALLGVGLASATSKGVVRLAGVLVAATFVTRFKFPVAGAHVRIEDVVVVALVVALLFRQATDGDHDVMVAMRARLNHPAIKWLLLYVVWSAVTSEVSSPDLSASLRISVWLALDWLILLTVVAVYPRGENVERIGQRMAFLAFSAADLLYVIGTRIGYGVQLAQSTTAGTKSAYGLSYEANILGSTAAIWLFIALTASESGGVIGNRTRLWKLLPAAMALILSFTRAAVVGLVVGLVVWAVIQGYQARRRLLRRAGAIATIVVVVLVAVPSVGGPVYTKLRKLVSLSSPTGATRVSTTNTAIGDLHGSGWLFGLGLNSYGQRHLDTTRPGQDVTGYLGELPVEVVYDTGIVGVLLLGAAVTAMRPWRPQVRGRALGLMVVFGICSLTTSPLWLGSSWILVALGVLSDHRTPRRQWTGTA